MIKRSWQSIKELLSLLIPNVWVEYVVFLVSLCFLLGCSIYINNLIPQGQQVEILGFDYSTYLHQFSELDTILQFPFRHPFLGIITAPFAIIGHLLKALSVDVYLYYLCVVFSTCVALAVLVCYKIQREVLHVRIMEALTGCMLFSSFAYMPLLAAVPESFPLSLLILVFTLYIGGRQLVLNKAHTILQWLTLFFLAGGVTISNATKVGLAFMISNRLNKKQLKIVVLGCLTLIAIGFLGYYLRMYNYNATHPEAPKTILRSLSQTCYWIRSDLSVLDRIDISTARFFSEPIIFHDNLLRCHEIPLRYDTFRPYFLLGTLYSLVLLSLLVGLKDKFTWLILSLFSVDVLIHLLVFWSTIEGYLFCGHWFFILPVLLAQSFTKIKNERLRFIYCILLFILASGNFISNFKLLLQASY